MRQKHTIVILNPGHFHAALALRERHPRIDDDVYVYAEEGPDVDNFESLVRSFNDRAADPTRWRLHVYRDADYLAKLIAQRPGDVVIVAGRNNEKMPLIHLLHEQKFHVLGDKPWLIKSEQIGLLKKVASTAPLAMDIMTERHEIVNQVQRTLVQQSEVFGDYRIDGDQPAVAIRSVHHLYKMVNNKPLRRPAWYFDPAVQGEGITDVTTHLVDLVQWITGNGVRFDFNWHVEQLSARQWPTEVSRHIFSRITGLVDFPVALRGRVVDGALQYLCNSALSYRLRGIPVEIEALWGLEESQGGGDLHHAILRGTRSDLIVDQGPETGFQTLLTVNPVEGGQAFAEALTDAVARMQTEFPGLGIAPTGTRFRITIPKALRTTHEQHFAAVLQTFLGYVDQGKWPGNLDSDLDTKYTLLAQARDLSHHLAPRPPRAGHHG